MTIHFVPNDPAAGAKAPPMRQAAARANRPAGRSSFTLVDAQPEGLALPGTPQFLFWQAREAALAALDAYEASAGPHKTWQGNRRKLLLRQDFGVDLNAYYDRDSFTFFHQQVGSRTYYSAASTDVVSHEVGHGLLDSLRPDLWDANYLEVGAFHEAFGDCIAILTALNDAETRRKLLKAAPTLRRKNFVEATAEELSKAIHLAVPGHNAAAPRRALNNFKYQIPSTLPDDGGPGELINEVHSFGMLFSGPFWDLIANLYEAAPKHDEASLLAAARTAGKILVAGVRNAVVTPRFLQSVGRAMTLADQALHDGANREFIGAAFARHDIALGSNALLAPSVALAGAAPRGATLGPATRKDLLRLMGGATGARLSVSAADVGGTPMVSAVLARPVPLTGLHPLLKGVVAQAYDPVIVGASGTRAAVMGAMPRASDADAEVQAFVESLLAHRRIRLEKPARAVAPAKAGVAAAGRSAGRDHATHVIETVGGRKVLRRLRFSCVCHPGGGWLAR